MKTKLTTVAALAAAGVLVLAGCAAESTDSTPGATDTTTNNSGDQGAETAALSGNILIDGSSTVGPASEIAAELFMEVNPGVRIAVNISGTGGGFEKFCNGETDASNASRFIKDEEAARCAEDGLLVNNPMFTRAPPSTTPPSQKLGRLLHRRHRA